MVVITKEIKAEAISQLAEKGLNVTIDCYIALITETFQQYSDVNTVAKKYKSITKAMAALSNAILLVADNPNNAPLALITINELYQEKIGPRQEKVLNPARLLLQTMIQLAGKYKRMAMLAAQYANGQATISEMKTKLTEIQYAFDAIMKWFRLYPKELAALQKGSGIVSIAQLLSSMEREENAQAIKIRQAI